MKNDDSSEKLATDMVGAVIKACEAVDESAAELRKFDFAKLLMREQVEPYNGNPRMLLTIVSNLLLVIRRTTGDPKAKRVFEDFYAALDRYRSADAADLGEAFKLTRPKNWNQEAEKFRSQEMEDIEIEIDDLRSQMPVMDAIERTANKHCKGVSKIRDNYYSFKKEMLPLRRLFLDSLEQDFYDIYHTESVENSFRDWFFSEQAKEWCWNSNFNYESLRKVLEKNEWKPSPTPK